MKNIDPVVTEILKEASATGIDASGRLMALLIHEVRLLREATAGLQYAISEEIDYQNARRRGE